MTHAEHTTWQESPLSAVHEPVIVPDSLSEGPVKFLLVSGHLDESRWGLIGAFWLSIDGERGGFIVAPEAIWSGSEMVRSYRSALQRGWKAESIYAYWQRQVGASSGVMIDPQQHADTLFHVARRIGAL
ncbi:MAG: hypothetical protein QOE83_1557 [Actinomycetota bacterium]|jgi:hypothetical protein|nr:hypothetical protein [Actinomycetota bacterium]